MNPVIRPLDPGANVHAPPNTPVIMDLAVMGDTRPDRALADLDWPSPYDAYHTLSRYLIGSLLTTIRALDPGDDAAAVIRAKAYDVITDLAFVTRLAFDIANARREDRVLLYDARTSPMLAYLDTGGDPAKSPILRIWHHPVDRRWKTRSRKALRRTRSHLRARLTDHDRIDVHNRNNLVNTVLGSGQDAPIDWPVTNLDWTDGHKVPPILTESVAELARSYTGTITHFIGDAALHRTLSALGQHLISHHIAKCWADFEILERHMRTRPMGNALISGTPKHLGRLTGWLYRRNGRPVIRCAHGGERVFFTDYEWGLAEFPYCDIYYAHSAGERDALENRLSSGATALVEPDKPIAFRTLGSPHHRSLLERSKARRRRATTGTIVYVAGGYLGEQFGDFPSRKPPDILYLDWQIDLIRALKKLGYRVVAKLHPAGIAGDARYLAHYADAILEGRFDPSSVSADAFVFDFAGTAFFDALATDIPVVFADMAIRPFDPITRADLSARCPIIPVWRDARGRFRVDRNHLGEAIENTINAETCPPGFHDRYFGA